MANQEARQYYSYAKLEKFRKCERRFRSCQSLLLLFMVICFIFYIITLGLDISKFRDDPPLLAAALIIVLVAMIFLIIGIRGVAFESCCMVTTFAISFFFITIAHGVSFLFRHPGLTAVNFALALLLLLGALLYICLGCRMSRLKPPDYGRSSTNQNEETESSVALTSEQQNAEYDAKRGFGSGDVEKTITISKAGMADLNRGLGDGANRLKRDLGNVKSSIESEMQAVKKDIGNLQAGTPETMEKEFVAVKRVLLNEAQKGLGDVKTGFGNIQRDFSDTVNREMDNVKREYTVVRKEVGGNVERLVEDVKGRYGGLEKELGGSFKSGLGDIEKEFNIFQREFGGGGDVQRVVSSVRRGFEEFKSGGENVKREIVEVKRDEHGNIISYVERRLTDSGVEISSVSVDKGRAPMANFST